jgi:hypothetical protein
MQGFFYLAANRAGERRVLTRCFFLGAGPLRLRNRELTLPARLVGELLLLRQLQNRVELGLGYRLHRQSRAAAQ